MNFDNLKTKASEKLADAANEVTSKSIDKFMKDHSKELFFLSGICIGSILFSLISSNRVHIVVVK